MAVLHLPINVALTVVVFSAVMVHVPVPEQPPPDQPPKTEPAAGVAVRVTSVPFVNPALHVVPQSMPDGEDVTVPAPFFWYALVTVTMTGPSKVALAVLAFFIAKVHTFADTASQPVQEMKTEPGSGVAVRVTAVL